MNGTKETVSKNSLKPGATSRFPGMHLGLFLLCVSLLLGAASSALWAQVTGLGVLSGNVTDSTGAVIVGAEITVTESATNVPHKSVTNGTGYFEVDSLTPGDYRISITAPGFQNLLRQGITLHADAHVNVPLELRIGSESQTVSVTADAGLLNTEDGSNGYLLTTREVEELPSAGANPMQLAQLAPGIQSPNSQTYSMGDTLSWNGVSKFGTMGFLNANEYSLDGAPNMGNPRGNAIELSEDEIGEMKVETVSFDAALGHTMGATVTQTTKSGTNDLHGAIAELYQDKTWAAMQHFQGLNYRYQLANAGCTNGNSSPKCLAVKDQYGQPGTHMNLYAGTVGGPVFIPKLFDGRNKFFFFVGLDGNTWIDASVKNASIPTIQQRSGDFSDLPSTTTSIPAAYVTACGAGTPYYGQYQIFNPFSITLDSSGVPRRAPFCGNKISANLMTAQVNPMITLYNSVLPTPTQNSPTGNNYTYTNANFQEFKQFTQRMDYAVSENNHVYFRWSRFHYQNRMRGFTVGNMDENDGDRWATIGSFGWNHVFNPRTNLNITGGASQYTTIPNTYPGYNKHAPSSVGLPSYLDSYASSGGAVPTLPTLTISNYSGIGATNTSAQIFRTLAFGSNLTRVQGSHTIRAGVEWQQQNFAHPQQANTSGNYTFNDTYTQQNNGTDKTYTQQNTGLAYAAFLLGIPSTSSVAIGSPVSIDTPYYAFYVADTWRVSGKLTINAGVRYEYEFAPAEKHNHLIVGWDANASLPISAPANTAYSAVRSGATAAQQAALPSSLVIQGGPMYAGANGAPTRMFVNNYRVMPRLSAAYRITPNTVLRAGYGLFYDTINAHGANANPVATVGGAAGTWGGFTFGNNQDGYSTSTSANSSPTGVYGANFTPGSSPLSDPFPTVNGSRFNVPIGNSAGAMYYLGSAPAGNPGIYDRGMVPARANRVYVGVQRQFGASTMVEVAYMGSFVTNILEAPNMAHVPASFFTGGAQPNTANNTLLSSTVKNPFAIGNFSSLAGTNAAAYGMMSLNSYFTSSSITVANLVKSNPQMTGLTVYNHDGQSNFHELQVNVTRRYAQGLTVMGALQINHQQDRDYYANPFDSSLSWEPSNNSLPYRLTAVGLYQLPLGYGRKWMNSGWGSRILGGFQLGGSYELQPGLLLNWGNLFYLGTPKEPLKIAEL